MSVAKFNLCTLEALTFYHGLLIFNLVFARVTSLPLKKGSENYSFEHGPLPRCSAVHRFARFILGIGLHLAIVRLTDLRDIFEYIRFPGGMVSNICSPSLAQTGGPGSCI